MKTFPKAVFFQLLVSEKTVNSKNASFYSFSSTLYCHLWGKKRKGKLCLLAMFTIYNTNILCVILALQFLSIEFSGLHIDLLNKFSSFSKKAAWLYGNARGISLCHFPLRDIPSVSCHSRNCPTEKERSLEYLSE